ncbi:heterokaryon incompatibility protein-domain-containing protein [Xylaria arbuscula]|nr:heterokaryon incompatibility protein-domain-containing protein [Xylaria arbuscula]
MAYIYELLPQDCHTRVLELHPALDSNAPLRGNFRNVNLETDPFYDAISYTWGEPNFTEEILIGEGFRLCITANLRDALIRFRYPTETRSIWADAICIDQNNVEEKNKQIPSMKDIYRCASSVLVWLGKHPVGDACLCEVSRLSQRKTIAAKKSDKNDIVIALNQLASVSWFKRRWIIQEIVLNPSVTFFSGTISMPWLRIVQLLHLVPKEHSSSPILCLHALKESWETHNRIGPPALIGDDDESPTGILHLLSVFSDTDCADARDRIYALVGLASDVAFEGYYEQRANKKILIRIDYTQSVKQVYHDFAQAVVNGGSRHDQGRLFTETDRRSNGSHMREWTSWVPDWRLPIARSAMGAKWMSISASHFFKRREEIIPCPKWTGEIVDIISAPYPTDANKPMKLEWLRSIFASIIEKHGVYRKDLLMDLEETTYVWDIIGTLFTLKPNREYLCARFKQLDNDLAMHEIFEAANLQSILDDYCLFTILVDKKTLPLIGIGPRHIKVGDLVYCADTINNRNTKYVMVLRETNESRNTRPNQPESQQGGMENNYTESRTFYFVGLANTIACSLRSDTDNGIHNSVYSGSVSVV